MIPKNFFIISNAIYKWRESGQDDVVYCITGCNRKARIGCLCNKCDKIFYKYHHMNYNYWKIAAYSKDYKEFKRKIMLSKLDDLEC